MDTSEDYELAESTPPTERAPASDEFIIRGYRLVPVIISFMLLMILAGLDLTIIASALVTITSRFNGVQEIAWVTSVMYTVQTGFQMLFGKFLNISLQKNVLLISAAIFVLGSLFCAVAPSLNVLIFGRAILGLGCTGIWIGILAIIGRISDLTVRPILIAIMVMMFGMASVIGPVIGAVLSERVSWRWCFYINLPIGAVAIILSVFFVPNLPSLVKHERSALHTYLRLDWFGTALNVVGVFLLIAGLQWGGNTKPWSDPGVILSVVLGVILICLFFVWEAYKGPEASLPMHMFKKPNILGSFFLAGFMHWSLGLIAFYMPILFQLRGDSVLKSGVDFLPYGVAGAVSGVVSGGAVTATGIIWPWLFFSPLIGVIGFVLLAVSSIHTSISHLIAYQFLVGFGVGSALQNCFVMAQAEYVNQEDLIPQATSLITLAANGFTAIGVAGAATIFSDVLHSQVNKLNLGLSESQHALVLKNIDAVFALPENLRTPLIHAYTFAVSRIWILGAVITSLGCLSSFLISRKRIVVKPPGSSPNNPQTQHRRTLVRRTSSYFDEIYKSYGAEPYAANVPLL